MIRNDALFVEECRTKFKVLKVHQEPYAESEWLLQYYDFPSFYANDQSFETTIEDEGLAGGEIEAQIDLNLLPWRLPITSDQLEKQMSFNGNIIKATGIYYEDIESHMNGTIYRSMILDSVFKLTITSNHMQDMKIGDWITVEGEATIILPRGVNLK